jgi:hypothetical protein
MGEKAQTASRRCLRRPKTRVAEVPIEATRAYGTDLKRVIRKETLERAELDTPDRGDAGSPGVSRAQS